MTGRRVWLNLRPVVGMSIVSALVYLPQWVVGWVRRRRAQRLEQERRDWRAEHVRRLDEEAKRG